MMMMIFNDASKQPTLPQVIHKIIRLKLSINHIGQTTLNHRWLWYKSIIQAKRTNGRKQSDKFVDVCQHCTYKYQCMCVSVFVYEKYLNRVIIFFTISFGCMWVRGILWVHRYWLLCLFLFNGIHHYFLFSFFSFDKFTKCLQLMHHYSRLHFKQ